MEDRLPVVLQFNRASIPWKMIPDIIGELRKHWARKRLEGEEQHLQFFCILQKFLCPLDAAEELEFAMFSKRRGGIPSITGAGGRQNLSSSSVTLCGLLLAENESLIKEAWGTLLQTHLVAARSGGKGLSPHLADSERVPNLIFQVYSQLASQSKAFAAAVLPEVNSPMKLREILASCSSPFRDTVLRFFRPLCELQTEQLLVEDKDGDSWCQLFGQIIDERLVDLNTRASKQCSDAKIVTRPVVDQLKVAFFSLHCIFCAVFVRLSNGKKGKGEYSKSYCQVFLKGFPKQDHLNDLLHFDDAIMYSCFSVLSFCVAPNVGDDVASCNTSSICDDQGHSALTSFLRYWQQLLVAEPKDWTRIERSVAFLCDLVIVTSAEGTLRLIQKASLIEIVRWAWFIPDTISTRKIRYEIASLLKNLVRVPGLWDVDAEQANRIFDEETGVPISEVFRRLGSSQITNNGNGEQFLMTVVGDLLRLFDGRYHFENSHFTTPAGLFAVIEACTGLQLETSSVSDVAVSVHVTRAILTMSLTSYNFVRLILFEDNGDTTSSASTASLQSSVDKYLSRARLSVQTLHLWLKRVQTHSEFKEIYLEDLYVLGDRLRETIRSCRDLVEFTHAPLLKDKISHPDERRQKIVELCWEHANRGFQKRDAAAERKWRDGKKLLCGLSDDGLRTLFTEALNHEQHRSFTHTVWNSHQGCLLALSRAIAFDCSVRMASIETNMTTKIVAEEIVMQMFSPCPGKEENDMKKKVIGLKSSSSAIEWQTSIKLQEVFSEDGQTRLRQLSDLSQLQRSNVIREWDECIMEDDDFPFESSLSFVTFLRLALELAKSKHLL